MVNFLRLYLLHETDEVGRIREIPSSSSARQAPSWAVMPVTKALSGIIVADAGPLACNNLRMFPHTRVNCETFGAR
jgi:hypothetical protein